ncbi:MAG: protein containing domain [Moraxellaceae bacterium]|jgi:DNA-binding Xre family transcriptional regulator|nr:protein containing domain [Moraxellaceae bacterium]
MAQTLALLETLKQEMRRQGRTYRQAASALGLSEASMKRLFSEQSFSLERLDALCQWLGMETSDLVQLVEKNRQHVSQLTETQESELVSDLKLLLMAHSLLSHWTFEEVIASFRISKTEGIRLLARLDRMGIIEMLPGNRVRLLISRNFHWLPNGPIQRFFERHVQSDFFRSRFDGPGECRLFVSGMLSRRANQEILRRMEKLAAEFNALHREDESLPLAERFGSSLVLAIRPWEVKVFEELRREPNLKKFR